MVYRPVAAGDDGFVAPQAEVVSQGSDGALDHDLEEASHLSIDGSVSVLRPPVNTPRALAPVRPGDRVDGREAVMWEAGKNQLNR